MRVLMLSQGRSVEDQPDFDEAFRNYYLNGKQVELLNIPFVGYVEKHGGEAFYNEVVRANNEFKPDLIFFQFFHSANPGNPIDCVAKLKSSDHKPLVFGSIGDPFDTGPLKFLGRPLPTYTMQLASCTDAFFSTSMGNVAEELVRFGAKNVVFLPHAFCQMHFHDWDSDDEVANEYGIVMLCSNGKLLTRCPLRSINGALRRRLVVEKLMKRFGADFSVFGRSWDGVSSRGTIPFKEQVNIYRKAKVLVDAPAPIINTTYYASDRPFFMLGSGRPLVFFHTPRFEKVLRSGEHAFYVHNADEAARVCERLLKIKGEELRERRRQMIAFVKERHLIKHRIDTIMSTYVALKQSRDNGVAPEEVLKHIRMWHFLPEVDLNEEYKFCAACWVG